MSSKDSGKQEPTILGVAEAGVPYGVEGAAGADGADAARSPQYRPLNLARLAEQGMLTQEGGRSSVAEDFRIIKRPLLRQARASGAEAIRHGNLIVVTSAMPGEGKTYCAVNLAMSIAMEMDITVLLVDADVARPSVLKVLGLPPEPGLMDVLLDPQLAMGDVILKTNVANLSILPAGRSNKHATELLASRAMSRLLAEIASRYSDRVVIFDSPPLLITSEAHALVGQMGQVVMVVEAETTTQHAVKEALRQIESCEHIHLIYNKTKSFPGNDYYGYGYYD
ncbi:MULTISPECIES: XrtA-associated tyrosine autokinase [unclassified Janthinobacterium]|uniref:XrtA-associated tyrosine autokinase n=1 Tax=unclassified Janthinobacterium TaxID=2610881 RepID=UPI000C1703D7|nr:MULTISPECIES: XrtA-associated tyrosine autokinase [unclassified Janthinobacterium]MDO8064825.1 XrtA-associated tyrosine autokinase [Janthinobacterium sp. SUN206]MED5612653.1 XrtA-associated tyrosine autokinase [Janthinobacterium sp. P210005]PIF13462.1 exopolysaccharide/PEP-CTERM locus tyrosine autokinase [Janthinobacterium sp. 13]